MRHDDAHSDEVPSYLSRLTQAPLLTADEERELTVAARKGSAEARERLIESNIRLVINIARSYHCPAIPLEDLIQEGVIGLIHAIERFDPEKGFRFSTYATHWIRQAVGRAVDGKAKAIRLPAHISQALRKVDRAREQWRKETGQDPTPEQLSKLLGISLRRLNTLSQAGQELLSLDMSMGDQGETTLGGMVSDRNATDPEQLMIQSEIVEELHDVLMQLTERERRIMDGKLRDSDGSGQFRERLSHELHISEERVRQIEIQAIKKLRQIAQRRRLKEYLGG